MPDMGLHGRSGIQNTLFRQSEQDQSLYYGMFYGRDISFFEAILICAGSACIPKARGMPWVWDCSGWHYSQ